MEYNNNHKQFLRTIMNYGIMDMHMAFTLCSKLFGKKSIYKALYISLIMLYFILECPNDDKSFLKNVIREINQQIRDFDQEIQIVWCDVTESDKIVFLSTMYDVSSEKYVLY